MTIQQLRYLVSIAQTNSISQAAQNLYVTQSNISKAIKQLEQELGTKLLDRDFHGVSFTACGLEFLQEARAILSHFDNINRRFSPKAAKAVSFSVSSQHYIFVLIAIEKICRLLDNHVYSVNLLEHKTPLIIKDVATYRSQIGFLCYYSVNRNFIFRELERNGLEFHPFIDVRPHVYMASTHPLAEEPVISIEKLEAYPYISYDLASESRDFAEEIYAPTFSSKAIFVTDRHSMLNIIAHTFSYTLGSGLLSDKHIAKEIISRPLSISPNSENAMAHIGWIAPKVRRLSPEAEQFIVFCEEALRECYVGEEKMI